MNDGNMLPEWRLDTFAIGHFKELNTHELTTTDSANRLYINCGNNVNPNSFQGGEWFSPNARVRLTPRSNFVQGDPYWVVYDQVLSKGHNDLKNARLNCMITDLLSTYTQDKLNLYR